MLGVWRSLADVPSRLVNSRSEDQPSSSSSLRPPAAVAASDSAAPPATSSGRGKPRGGGARSHALSKMRHGRLQSGLQAGRQGGRGSRSEEGGFAGSSEGTGEDDSGGRGDGSKARGERRAAKYKGVTWDRVKKMWRCVLFCKKGFLFRFLRCRIYRCRVRLCLVGGSRQHVGYFADEDEVSADILVFSTLLDRR